MTKAPHKTRSQVENSISEELTAAGNRSRIVELERRYREFMAANFPEGDPRALKHGYAFRLSNALARTVANALRSDFPGILPDPDGKGSESAAPVHTGFKRLDVNYSTIQLGLALGISIKTLNFSDEGSGRFTKNATRIDNELRAEALDYHGRQPYCVMVALVFVPKATTSDPGRRGRTSFRHIYEVLCKRAGRRAPTDANERFEKIFLGTYDEAEGSIGFGRLAFVEILGVDDAVNAPVDSMTFDEVVRAIGDSYLARNPRHRSRP